MIQPATIGKGIIAGLTATVVLSILMMMKSMMGIMPELDVISMLSSMMGNAGPAVGWAAHVIIGALVWGTLYAIVSPRLPGAAWLRGALFATVAWLMMMVVVMPMAGAGLFGLNFGMMAPLMTLMLHWIFGAVLGTVYAALGGQTAHLVGAH